MISACSSASSPGAQAPTQQSQTAPKTKPQAPSTQEDTIHLSPAAQAASSAASTGDKH
jgi:hypothetical protein